MLVGERHDEAVQPVRLQLFAKGGKAGFVGRHGKFLVSVYVRAR
jgi:hypothetical protein